MKISFTGINNININACSQDVDVNFETPNGQRKTCDGVETTIKLKCELSDDLFDKDGQDLGKFYKALHKTKLNCTNPNNPNLVDIQAKQINIADGDNNFFGINFSINDCPINLDTPAERKFLHLYSFIAQLTSKIAEQKNLTDDEKECVMAINDYAHTKAMHFIDNII